MAHLFALQHSIPQTTVDNVTVRAKRTFTTIVSVQIKEPVCPVQVPAPTLSFPRVSAKKQTAHTTAQIFIRMRPVAVVQTNAQHNPLAKKAQTDVSVQQVSHFARIPMVQRRVQSCAATANTVALVATLVLPTNSAPTGSAPVRPQASHFVPSTAIRSVPIPTMTQRTAALVEMPVEPKSSVTRASANALTSRREPVR